MTAKDKQVGGDHYKDMAIQPSEFIHKNRLNWYEGNIVKYACRHAKKGGREDVEKIIHYAEMLLEDEYRGAESDEFTASNEFTAWGCWRR